MERSHLLHGDADRAFWRRPGNSGAEALSAGSMIELHMFPAAWGLPTFTPFGLKLAAHMTLAKLPFNFVYEGNPARGPRKKLPWIKDGEHVVSDSARAVEHLTAHYDDRLDG